MAAEFVRACGVYGLKQSDLGRKEIIAGIKYELVGLAPRSPKFPILAKRVDNGITYKFTEQTWNRRKMK